MKQTIDTECKTCLSLNGIQPLFPESRMFEGKFWVVEHSYPVLIKGWVVIILKRHVSALHDLTLDEFNELAFLQEKITKILNKELKTTKEYSVCFAEGDGFKHIHFHIIARTKEMPEETKGTNIFSMLRVDAEHSISKEEILELCKIIKKELEIYT